MNRDKNLLFVDNLQKGLGRTFNCINRNEKEEIKHDLLNACLHHLAYDPQCEGSRADWLFELITLTDDIEFYRQNIFQALPNTTNFWDVEQLYDLIAIWANKGCEEARGLIYENFAKQEFDESWLGGTNIIAIDGITGLLYVAEIVGKRLLKDDDLWEDDWLISVASERLGKEIVRETLEKQSLSNPNIKAYLDAVKNHHNNLAFNKKIRSKTKRNIIALDTVLERIDTIKHYKALLKKFGKYAEEEEIERVFQQLIKETRREQLIRYLWIFRKRKLPRLDNRILELAKTNDEELQLAAIAVLANNKDDSIRDLAIELLQKQTTSYNKVLELLINNYQPGDFKIIESILNTSSDDDFKHDLCWKLIEIANTQKTTELTAYYLWVYENTPCSSCRKRILKILIELKQAPKHILTECLKDCSSEIKELAKKELQVFDSYN